MILELLIDTLNNWGYEHTDHTINPKSFSTRGGILDVFLPYTVHPIRLEFFGNEIESLREFNPRSHILTLYPDPALASGNNSNATFNNGYIVRPIFVIL